AEAASTGHRDTLLRVARSVGETCLHAGRRMEARDAFQRALRIAEAPAPKGAPPGRAAGPPAADLLGVLLGLGRAGAVDPGRVLRALSLAPAALEDAEAWWDLPCLLDDLAALAGHPALGAPELQAAMATVLRAAAQRTDTRERAAALAALSRPSAD
ncbi:MAG TPA: hypothetical protein VLS89_11870, partial [Candidatus Nanopelagicales bacterium]|nr:hypothetical protein [Candidatus Nanopelagicales bacterium]